MKTFKKVILFGAGEPHIPDDFNVKGSDDDVIHFIDAITSSHARFDEQPDSEPADVTYEATGCADRQLVIDRDELKDMRRYL